MTRIGSDSKRVVRVVKEVARQQFPHLDKSYGKDTFVEDSMGNVKDILKRNLKPLEEGSHDKSR